jgi:DNA-binding HxlR family transcriptional regulator
MGGKVYSQKSISPEEKKEFPTLISEWLLPGVNFAQRPIRTSLGVLDKKWTLLILRDIGILGIDRFNRILDSLPGLTPSSVYALEGARERGIHRIH